MSTPAFRCVISSIVKESEDQLPPPRCMCCAGAHVLILSLGIDGNSFSSPPLLRVFCALRRTRADPKPGLWWGPGPSGGRIGRRIGHMCGERASGLPHEHAAAGGQQAPERSWCYQGKQRLERRQGVV